MGDAELIRKKTNFNGEEIEVIYRKMRPRPEIGEAYAKALSEGRQPIYMRDGFGDYPTLNPGTYEASPGIICERAFIFNCS